VSDSQQRDNKKLKMEGIGPDRKKLVMLRIVYVYVCFCFMFCR